MRGLECAEPWLSQVTESARADVERLFERLLRRVRNELRQREGLGVGKAAAGACLVVAVKVEDGMSPPVDGLCAVLGVSKRALLSWEARVLDLLDWNLQLSTAAESLDVAAVS